MMLFFATSTADCGCGEPIVLMLYRTVDVVATAAIELLICRAFV
jgi:hypothetical protein